jgi:uncharacterized protein YndB with AHSA1/START domain
MIKTVLIVLAVLLAAFLGLAATRPDSFAVQRSVVVKAPPDKLYPLISDLHAFNRWNPYLKKDPQIQNSYDGPASGPGARYSWQGNKEVGKGSMTVATLQPPNRVLIDLQFMEPFESRSQAEFTLQPGADGTRVTWAMTGPAPYITKVMGLVFDMDKMIGRDFEDGLAQLKTLAEKP